MVSTTSDQTRDFYWSLSSIRQKGESMTKKQSTESLFVSLSNRPYKCWKNHLFTYVSQQSKSVSTVEASKHPASKLSPINTLFCPFGQLSNNGSVMGFFT